MDYSRIADELEQFRKEFRALHPSSGLDDMDWRRCSYALRFVVGRSMCEVGPGVGQMLNAVQHRMTRLSAIDIRKNSMAMFPPRLQYIEKSITAKDLHLDPHDTVVCMEVMEHMYTADNQKMLENIRKMTGRRLLLTVPYNEPEPLWGHDKPGGHRQRFTVDKLSELFPTSYATILPRYGVDWVFLVEDRYTSAPHFQIVSRENLISLYGGLAD